MFSSYWLKSSLLLCGFFSAPLAAGEIYKWVDQAGGTHYSETPPEIELSSLEIVEVASRPVEVVASKDYQAALDVANSMQAGRLERERLRLEKQKLEQLKRQAELDAMRYEEVSRSQAYFWPYYGYRHHRPPYGRPPGHQKPPHGHRPPSGPYRGGDVPRRVHINR